MQRVRVGTGGGGAYIGAATVPNEDFVSAVIYT